MNHLFTLRSSKGVKLFLPIVSVLKVDKSPPAASKASSHPYNTRDKHSVGPKATIDLIQQYSKRKGQSETQFVSQQIEHHENYQIKKRQEEAAKRQEIQKRPPGNDVDEHIINVDEQKRLYEEAQRASKQGVEGQKNQIKHNMDAHSGGISSSQQHGERHNQPPAVHHNQPPAIQHNQPTASQHNQQGIQQDSNVDHAGYGHNVWQQQLHGPQVPHHQNQQSGYYQDHSVDPTGYRYIPGQQQFYNPQVPLPHQGQQPGYYDQDVAHHQNQSNSQLPYPQSDPDVQVAHILREGVGENCLHYNPATGMPYNYIPRQQIQHQYESIPGSPDQPDPYSQQQQQQNPSSNQINPHNLEEGSKILYGNIMHVMLK